MNAPLIVAPVQVGAAGDLPALQKAFAHAERLPLQQRFPGGDAAAAATGFVRVGWSGTCLHLCAELDDDHIFTRATQFNEMLFKLGDCFEIFLQREGDAQYLEFHVAPNNVALQLLFPSNAERMQYRKQEAAFRERFLLPEPAFSSRTWVANEERRWTVFASIDLKLLAPALTSLAGSDWRFLFSRYDYPAGDRAPVLSCTGELSRLDFHASEDWGTLRFS